MQAASKAARVCVFDFEGRKTCAAYPIFAPHDMQNFAPLASAPHFGHFVGAAGAASGILVPHSGQNFAPAASAPHLGQAVDAGCTIAPPHSGQNFVPFGAGVPHLEHRAS